MVTAQRFYRLLGLAVGAGLDDAKVAYHALAKRNHPDLYPDDQRQKQQLKMMRINEAYMAVVSDIQTGVGSVSADTGDEAPTAGPARSRSASPTQAEFFDAWQEKAQHGPASLQRSVGQLRDPAYSYYKAGFQYFKLGTSAIFKKEAAAVRKYLTTHGSVDGYILTLALRAVHYFERSYNYFLIVVEQYGSSPWSADARWKLRRLEKYSQLYQRICENLARQAGQTAAHAEAHPVER